MTVGDPQAREGTRRTSETDDEELLERSLESTVLADSLAAVTETGRGRLVLVAGEAGIGKTTLLRAFAASLARVRVLAGACEALHTARPLGPLIDIAAETRGPLAKLLEVGASPSDVLAALLNELRRSSPTVVVLEDLHWADQATLDILRLLGRRIAGVPALVVVTYRDQLARNHPLRIVLGELQPATLTRLALAPLSVSAVAAMARPHGVDAAELHARTSGNPFYVTEAIAAGGARVPDSVRDAVLARSARLAPGARNLLDAVAIAPPRAELWLLEALAGGDLAHLEDCLASGMVRAERDSVAFRHEIARVAIEEALPPDRRLALHRRALPALAAAPRMQADLARLAHHAEAAGDGTAVLQFAPVAGERAAALGAHREAAAQFGRAARFADGLAGEELAELLERWSYESYLTDAMGDAITARRRALTEHHRRGDRLREADARRWLSRLTWFTGDNTAAEAEGRLAVELLEGLPPGAELAMAYSNMAQLRMLASDVAGARAWGGRAIELAERFGEIEILVHALNNVGTAELMACPNIGAEMLERSLALALDAGLEEHVARAHTNLGGTGVESRDYARGDRHLESGIAYCRERDLDSWRLYMTGWKARSQLEQGDWDGAATSATAVLDQLGLAVPTRITPLVVLGRLRARRGDPDPWGPLDEALELARATGEIQRLAPVAAARAEARWLAGEPELAGVETEAALAHPLVGAQPWSACELASWRRRAGAAAETPAVSSAEPYRLELAGEPERASRLWRDLGCPYEAALALLESEDEAALRWSLAELQRLGARPAAERVSRKLRDRGIRNVRQGPRAATRENPAGLTRRELEVVQLLARGMRNADIAERLVLSVKTVDHHVSAILRKLSVATRTEAAAEATRLGIVKDREASRCPPWRRRLA